MTSSRLTSGLEGAVMAWTVFTTVFLWTPTMRGLFRPDISTWSVMGFHGTGRSGSFWLFPTLAALAVLTFYLYGRNWLRPLVYTLLAAWHGLLTVIVVAGIMREGGDGSFQGAMWGVEVPLAVLVVPFAGFLLLTITWIAFDRRTRPTPAKGFWTGIDVRALAGAALLLPVAIILFRVGDGIDWPTRFGTAATILQWILLVGAVSNPASHGDRAPNTTRHYRQAGTATADNRTAD